MKRRFLWYIVWGLIACGVARAEIPLVLETTIQLPASGPWDVQHWMSDSTFGWACIARRDTVLYCPAQGDSVRRVIIPPNFCLSETCEVYMYSQDAHQQVRLLRLDRNPSHCFIGLQSWDDVESDRQRYLLSLFDLTEDEVLWCKRLSGSYGGGGGMYSYGADISIGAFLPWPPPPDTSQVLLTDWICNYGDGGDYWDETEYYSSIWKVDLNSPSFDAQVLCSGKDFSPFARWDMNKLAVSGEHYYQYYRYQDTTYGYDSCWVNSVHAGDGTVTPRDSTRWSYSILAQRDADGTERMILFYRTQMDNLIRAVNANTYELLWENNAIVGPLYTAQFDSTGNERLLA